MNMYTIRLMRIIVFLCCLPVSAFGASKVVSGGGGGGGDGGGGMVVAADGDDVLDLFDTYLKMPEFMLEKNVYGQWSEEYFSPDVPFEDEYSNSSVFPFEYPKLVIEFGDYKTLISNFVATYRETPQGREGFSPHIQKIMVPEDSRIIFIGDLHGNIQALVRMLCKLMDQGVLDAQLKIKIPNAYLIFLGDFVDYGRYGADTLGMAMRLRVQNPEKVFLCRGNHEDKSVYSNPNYGFQEELNDRYGFGNGMKLEGEIAKLIKALPYALFVGIEGNAEAGFIQCCHGGIDETVSPQISSLLESTTDAFNVIPAPNKDKEGHSNLQWGDFTGEILPLGSEVIARRGIVYDIDGAKEIMSQLNIHFIIRGHQDGKYSSKNVVIGIKDPISLFPVEEAEKTSLDPYQSWIKEQFRTLQDMWNRGFILGDLPPFIGPIFTLTNASSTRSNYDEGFGVLEVGDLWQASRLRFFIHRPEIFVDRVHAWEPKKSRLPEGIIPAGFTVSEAVLPAFLSPHYTYILPNGDSKIYLEEIPDRAKKVFEEGYRSRYAKHFITVRDFFMNKFKKPDEISGPGISEEFKTRIRTGKVEKASIVEEDVVVDVSEEGGI